MASWYYEKSDLWGQPTSTIHYSGLLDLETEVPHALLVGLDQLLAVLLPVLHDAAVAHSLRFRAGAAGLQLGLLESERYKNNEL